MRSERYAFTYVLVGVVCVVLTNLASLPLSSQYDQLVQFKERHGHCIVTRKQDNSLGIWVQKQRKFFRERQAGKTSNILTSDKVDLLNSIGFAWDVSPGTKSVKSATNVRSEQPKAEDTCRATEETQDEKDVDDDHWDQMFFELSQYRVINGHTNVQPWPTEPRVCELLAWCNVQRHNYANLWSGKGRYSPITEIQIRQLNQVSPRCCSCTLSRCPTSFWWLITAIYFYFMSVYSISNVSYSSLYFICTATTQFSSVSTGHFRQLMVTSNKATGNGSRCSNC